MRYVVFTDLDGTLLNHHDYRCDAALPVLRRLTELDVPVVFVSSKTADEIITLRAELENTGPFVCENGGIVVTSGELRLTESDAGRECNGLHYYYRGRNRDALSQALAPLRNTYRFEAFSDMTVADIMRYTGLGRRAAERAARREASEPLLWRDSSDELEAFKARLSADGLRAVRGGRFIHVMDNTDKGAAVGDLIGAYTHCFGEPVHSIGLGDSPNDIDMLNRVDTPVVIPRADGGRMALDERPDAVHAGYPGARGWAEVVTNLLERFGTQT